MLEPIADRDAFLAELRRALLEFDGNQKDLAAELDVSTSKISDWKQGRVGNPTPAEVFRWEKAMACTPGRLSSHLGYLPLEAAGTVEAAIMASDLPVPSRDVLLQVYKQLCGEHRRLSERSEDPSEPS